VRNLGSVELNGTRPVPPNVAGQYAVFRDLANMPRRSRQGNPAHCRLCFVVSAQAKSFPGHTINV